MKNRCRDLVNLCYDSISTYVYMDFNIFYKQKCAYTPYINFFIWVIHFLRIIGYVPELETSCYSSCSQLEFCIIPLVVRGLALFWFMTKPVYIIKVHTTFRLYFIPVKEKIWTLLTLRQRLSIAPIFEKRENEQEKKLIEPSLALLLLLLF